jgi:hypothetical protein
VASWAGPRERERKSGEETEARLGRPKTERERSRPAWSGLRPPGHTGKKVSSFYFFLLFSYIYLFSKAILKWVLNPNQIKPKPHHTIKQMQQHECIIKYPT